MKSETRAAKSLPVLKRGLYSCKKDGCKKIGCEKISSLRVLSKSPAVNQAKKQRQIRRRNF
jgi:hypothetical protein